MTTYPLPYDTGPHDEPAGHSFAAAWWTLSGFGLLASLLALMGFQWAAMNHFFGV